MTSHKPVLRCETETIHNVEVNDLETFVQTVTGHTYECSINEEFGNDSQHRFSVNGKIAVYQQKDWDKFKKTGETQPYSLRCILNGLVQDGHMAAGIYLIIVCW